jgi:hypothetical protein
LLVMRKSAPLRALFLFQLPFIRRRLRDGLSHGWVFFLTATSYLSRFQNSSDMEL